MKVLQRKKNKEENEEIICLKKSLKDQEKKIDFLKKSINQKKMMVEQTYQYQLIREKEDELFHLTKEVENLIEEKEGLGKVRKEQDKIIKCRTKETEEAEKRDKLADRLRGKLLKIF